MDNLYKALSDLVDGLDSNGDPEICGLSQEQWDERVKAARKALEEYEEAAKGRECPDEYCITELLFNLASIPRSEIIKKPNNTVALSGKLCRAIAKSIRELCHGTGQAAKGEKNG